MSYLRHFARLFSDLLALAREHKVWWMVPLVLLLLLIAGLVAGVSTISPFIYSLF